MLSINKKKYLDLVKRTKRPDWWKISFDYSLPKDEEASAKSNINLPLNAQSSDKKNILEMWHNRVDFLKEEKKKQEKEARQKQKLELLKKLVGEEQPKEMVSSVQEPSLSISQDSSGSMMGRARDSFGSFPIQYLPPSSYQSYNEDASLIQSIQDDILEEYRPGFLTLSYDLQAEPETEDLVNFPDLPKPISGEEPLSLVFRGKEDLSQSLKPLTKQKLVMGSTLAQVPQIEYKGSVPQIEYKDSVPQIEYKDSKPKTMGELKKELFEPSQSITTAEIKKILDTYKFLPNKKNTDLIKQELQKQKIKVVGGKRGGKQPQPKLRDDIYDALLKSKVFNTLDRKTTSLKIPELIKPSLSVASI